jgi:hypothetical protein
MDSNDVLSSHAIWITAEMSPDERAANFSENLVGMVLQDVRLQKNGCA